MAHRPGRPRTRNAAIEERFLEREFHRFLEACPAAHAHIYYLPLQGYDEPQMWADEHCVRLFTQWVIEQGVRPAASAHALADELVAMLRGQRPEWTRE
jgi:hypothetical protein